MLQDVSPKKRRHIIDAMRQLEAGGGGPVEKMLCSSCKVRKEGGLEPDLGCRVMTRPDPLYYTI